MLKRILALSLAAIMSIAMLAGCGASETGGTESTGGDTGATTESESTGTEEEGATSEGTATDTLIVSQGADAATLDPQGGNDQPSSRIMKQIYDTLFVQDENMDVQPGLVETYEIVDDGTTLNITLREGVTFHNGNALTTEDVKFTLERAIESPHVGHIVSAIDPANIVITDDLNMSIGMLYPFAPILSHLAHTGVSIVNKAAVEEGGETYGQNPVGTGPYSLAEWKSGESLSLVRNDSYWNDVALTQNILFRVIPETETAMLELETGGIDIIYDIAASNIGRVEGNADLELVRSPNFSTTYIGFNLLKEPYDDVLVRQAINHALNMEEIVTAVYYGAGSPAKGPIGSSVWAYNDSLTGYEYDVEKAKELLTEAGYPDGFSTTLWVNDGNQQRSEISVIVQNQLKEVGIEVEIEVVEWTKYLDDTAAGLHDMFILGWVTVTGDPDYGLYATFHSEQQGSAGNRAFYANSEVDSLLDEARTSADQDLREANYHAAQELIAEDAPWIFTWEGEDLTGLRSNIEGFVNNPAGHHVLKTVSKS